MKKNLYHVSCQLLSQVPGMSRHYLSLCFHLFFFLLKCKRLYSLFSSQHSSLPLCSNLSKIQETVKDGEIWHGAVHGVAKSQTWLVTKQQQPQKDSNLTGLGAHSSPIWAYLNSRYLVPKAVYHGIEHRRHYGVEQREESVSSCRMSGFGP